MRKETRKEETAGKLLHPGAPRSIVIFRALQLGDLMCALPAFRAIRHAFPQSHVALVGLPWASEFVDRYDAYFDEFIAFPGYPRLPEQRVRIAELVPFLRRMRDRKFDLALQMHGDGTISNRIVGQFGARDTAGTYRADLPCPDPMRFMVYRPELPEVRRHLSFVEFLGLPIAGEHRKFPIRPDDRRRLEALPEAALLRGRRYAVVHAGARDFRRRWLLERFASVADELVATGLQVVLTGTADERPIAERVESAMRSPAVNLAGRTDLGMLAALLDGSRIVVCNDTGLSHLADALNVPSVIVFTASEPERWAPLDRVLHRVVHAGEGDVQRVLAEADALLSEEYLHAS